MTTQKKQYERPAMQVYELMTKGQLLTGSSISGDFNSDADLIFGESDVNPFI